MTRIDIITITKDDIKGVCNTVKSTRALRQRSEFKQIIVDSSSDEGRKQVEVLIHGEPSIEYIWQKPSGIASAFNKGLRQSDAQWVWFLNGGDEVHPDVEAENLLFILRNTLADAVIFQMEFMQSGDILERPPLSGLWPPIINWIPHPSTVTRKNLYTRYGNFNESYKIAMDYDFWFRCFSKDTVVDTLSIKLSKHDEGGLSNTNKSLAYREILTIIKNYWPQVVKVWLINVINRYHALRIYIKGSSIK